MGNGTKVALVALLILMVVVIARFVKRSGEPESKATLTSQNPGKSALDKGAKPAIPADRKAPGVTPIRSAPGGGLAGQASTQPSARPTGTGGVASASGPSGQSSSSGQGSAGPLGPSSLLNRDPRPHFVGLQGAGVQPTEPGPSSLPPAKSTPPADKPAESPQEPRLGDGPLLARGDAGLKSSLPPTSIRQETTVKTAEPGTPNPAGSASQKPGDGASDLQKGKDKEADPDRVAQKPQTTPPGTQPPSPPDSGLTAGFPKTHTVEKGDGYWRIAKRYYGFTSDAVLAFLAKANPGVKLQPGKQITVPALTADLLPKPKPKPKAPEATPQPLPTPKGPSGTANAVARAAEKPTAKASTLRGETIYEVKPGDTLGGIALLFFKSASKIDLIEKANPDLHLGLYGLKAGAKLKIPAVE